MWPLLYSYIHQSSRKLSAMTPVKVSLLAARLYVYLLALAGLNLAQRSDTCGDRSLLVSASALLNAHKCPPALSPGYWASLALTSN